MHLRERPPRDLRPALSFAIVAGLEAGAAGLVPAWAAVPLLWAALGTSWVAVAYLRNAPSMLAKGSRASLVLLLPFHAVARGVARLARRTGLSAPPDEIVPGLFVGGWPSRGAPGLAQLDCTAELPRRGDSRAYACFPMLDGAAPPAGAWDDAVAQALAWRSASLPVLVHCAYGHGRSVSVIIGVLLAEGRFQSWQEAYAHVRAIRPRAHLTRGQRQHLEAHAPAARANVG